MKKPFHVFVLAGEASGDIFGANLLKEFKVRTKNNIKISGIGGELMSNEGLDSLFPMAELSVMGLVEVIKHLPTILKRMKETEQAIRSLKPDVIVTIDSPDFSFRLAKKIRDTKIPHVHLIAPTLWAWRPGRAKKIAKIIDHILVIFPFEPPYFIKEGLPCTYIGHPVCDLGIADINRQDFRHSHKIEKDVPVLCLLPGSRKSEIEYLWPIFQEAVNLLLKRVPELKVVIPVAATVSEIVTQRIQDWSVDVLLITDETEKYTAMRASDIALAASGTVNLQLAMAGIPFVIGYKMNALTAWLAKHIVKVSYMTMVNILLDREAVPEFFQNQCTALNLYQALYSQLTDRKIRHQIQKDLKKVTTMLNQDQTESMTKAVDVILDKYGI